MELLFVLPGVRRKEITPPITCPYKDCQGIRFRLHQRVPKYLNDAVYAEVTAYRYQCLTCGRTFRVYPKGVSSAQTSLRVKRMAVMLYLMGLSYGETSSALQALGDYISKSQVYHAVQEVKGKTPGLERRPILQGVRAPLSDSDLPPLKADDHWLSLRLTVDDTLGTILTLAGFGIEDAEALKIWIAPIAEAVGAKLLMNDADPPDRSHRAWNGHLRVSWEASAQWLEEEIKKEMPAPSGATQE